MGAAAPGCPPAPVRPVAVFELDRAARSVSHLVRPMEILGSLGIDFTSLTEAWDTTTPQGLLILAPPVGSLCFAGE